MATQTQEEKLQGRADRYDPFDMVFGERKSSTALDWAVLGCLIAGAVGIYKAFCIDSPSGVLLCLLGSVTAFGLVIYVHLRK
jgi:hypothetical protein